MEDLQELLDICNKVIESLEGQELKEITIDRGMGEFGVYKTMQYENIEVAKELLPTVDGCFFGPIEYGDYYLETTKATKKWLDEFFENGGLKDDEILEYWASW